MLNANATQYQPQISTGEDHREAPSRVLNPLFPQHLSCYHACVVHPRAPKSRHLQISYGATITLTPLSNTLSVERTFWDEWEGTHPKPVVVNVFGINHQGEQVWYNYDDYRKRLGLHTQKFMWHGTTRACNIGDDSTQINACHLDNCGVCHILRATLDPSRANPKSMFGIGAYVAPNSSKSAPYCKNADPTKSPNVVLLRCAVSLGKEYRAKHSMVGVTGPPAGFDSITGLTKAQGGKLRYSESVVFTKDAILPVQVIVLRFSNPLYVSPAYSNYTKKLINVAGGNWNLYPEAIRDTYMGEILWTDGNASYTFRSAPSIKAYKVVRRNPAISPTGTVVAEGYVSAHPFYFKLES